MARYHITCFNEVNGAHAFYFDGDNYKEETIPRGAEARKKQRIIRFCDHCGKPNMINVDPYADKGNDVDVAGIEASNDDVDMVNKGQGLIIDASDRLDSLSEKMIPIVTGFIGIYTGALTFFKIPENMGKLSSPGWLLYAPIFIWFISIVFYLWEIFPFYMHFFPNTPDSIRSGLKDVTDRKFKLLICGFFLFLLGLGLASYSIIDSSSKASSSITDLQIVQFIVPAEQASFFKNLNLTVSDDTLRTSNITLIDAKDGLYTIQVPGDNRNITLNQSLVKGVIYF